MRGKGVKHGFNGALRTPSYYMSNKEKKNLNGEVETFNMYETILPITEFNFKDTETQKTMLTRWREIYGNSHIQKEMGLTNKAFYELVSTLQIPRKTRIDDEETTKRTGKTKQIKQAKAKTTPKKTLMDAMEFITEVSPEKVEKKVKEQIVQQIQEMRQPETVRLITNGIHFEYNRPNDDAEEINRILTKVQLLVDGESKKFRISVSLSEIDE
jgi:hypothetical protein